MPYHKEEVGAFDTKRCLIMKGRQTSQVSNQFLADISMLLKPFAKKYDRKNDIRLFEAAADPSQEIETYCRREDATLFAVGSSSKKRPHNIVMGRLFDGQLLDVVEFGVADDYVPLLANSPLGALGSPLIAFDGAAWTADSELKQMRNLLLDFFHKQELDKVLLPSKEAMITGRSGLDKVIVFSAPLPDLSTLNPQRIVFMRVYHITPSDKSVSGHVSSDGHQIPDVTLQPAGMSATLTLRRAIWADTNDSRLYRRARQRPRHVESTREDGAVTLRKSVVRDKIGHVKGHLFVDAQDFNQLSLHRFKALKKSKKTSKKAASEQ